MSPDNKTPGSSSMYGGSDPMKELGATLGLGGSKVGGKRRRRKSSKKKTKKTKKTRSKRTKSHRRRR